MPGDPVAWRVIEQGWSVIDAEGNEVGKVDQITGDIEDDIFDGITIGDGGTVLTRVRYVPSEDVAQIYKGQIVLRLTADEAAKLEPYQALVSQPLADLAPEEAAQPAQRQSFGERLRELFFGRQP